MIVANYSELRKDLKMYLDNVEFENETIIIKRGSGNGAILMSLQQYNSIIETLHLISSKRNEERLDSALDKANKGQTFHKNLIEE